MAAVSFEADSQGNIIAKNILDPNTGLILETIELSEEEKEELTNPESQFSNVDSTDVLLDE